MKALTAALVGNPNCGKTTLFNALTGARQQVGNWPGVTVERKSGVLAVGDVTVELVDLPGVYSLMLTADDAAIDERIACEFILQHKADVIINIVDASHLARHLYLTLQLLEMGVPVILALNMADVARAQQIHIDVETLSRALGCPVVVLEAHTGSGIDQLKRSLDALFASGFLRPRLPLIPDANSASRLQQPIDDLLPALTNTSWPGEKSYLALRLLEGDAYAEQFISADIQEQVNAQRALIQHTLQEDADILFADARYRHIQQLMEQCVSKEPIKISTWTTWLDRIVLNRVLGIPIFLGVMYLLFFFSINVGCVLQAYFDSASEAIVVQGVANVLTQWHAPSALIALLANGVGKGINTTITFIPVIGALFLFLAFLEDSGYMARAAFVVDRLMRTLGLPGKAFVPMIVGFGCNVPAVMAARTLENKRDRVITIMMSPFMSCGARLAIYAVFTAAFFPHGGQNIVFALYLMGIFMAVFTGFILRKTLLQGKPAPLLMEMPAYHVPRIKSLCLHAWQRLKGFVLRAGKLIVLVSILIGVLNTLSVEGALVSAEGDAQSLLSSIGKSMTFIFEPMGVHADNWPATVGLVTGVLAKEVVVGTLNTLYTQMSHLPLSGDHGVYGLMAQKFDGKIGAFAYLLFVLLYFPCVSTMAAMLRELHRGWALFSAYWSTGVAYAVAVMFYQAATWVRHPLASSLWIATMLFFFFGTIGLMRWYAVSSKQDVHSVGEPLGETQ